MLNALKEYKDRHGDCNVPAGWAGNDIKLGSWVGTQRTRYSEGKLSNDRIKRLEDVGFVWDGRESSWEKILDVLKEYKINHGDCNVPSIWLENKKLAGWVQTQRHNYRKGNLEEYRITRLEDIGVEWTSLRDEMGEEGFTA